MDIQAAVVRELNAPFHIETVQLSEPQDDEVLVRICAVGVCHTDVAARDGHLPIRTPAVLGHEGAGVVERVGASVTKVQPGDKVVLTFIYCGRCENCRRGDVAYCEDAMGLTYGGVRGDGSATICEHGRPVFAHFFGQSSFGTYALANERNTVKLPPDAPLHLAAPLGCGIQTGFGAVQRSLQAQRGRSLTVFGCGSVGLSAVMAAVVCGCHPIIAVEPVAARRDLALQLGATLAIDPAAGDVEEQIRARLERGTDYVVDTTGAPPVIQVAMASLARHGAMVWLGVPSKPDATIELSVLGFLASGATLKAVIEGDSLPEEFIPELLALHQRGQLPLEKIVRTYPFSKINQAVEDQLTGATIKAVLILEDEN